MFSSRAVIQQSNQNKIQKSMTKIKLCDMWLGVVDINTHARRKVCKMTQEISGWLDKLPLHAISLFNVDGVDL